MGFLAVAEARKNFVIACSCFGVAAVAGAALIITNINKTPEQVSNAGDNSIEVPYTSSDGLSQLGIIDEITSIEEGEKSATLGAEQLAKSAVSDAANPASSNSTANNPTNSESSDNTGQEGGQEEQPDYLLELDLHEDGVVYMQDVTYEMIDAMTEDTMTVVDRRTGYSYEVYKAYPGSRWGNQTLYMSTDLKLGSTEKPMLLTPKNTNIYSNYVLPASTDVKEYDDENPIEESINIDGDSYLYSPAAALAGSQLEDFGDDISIYNSPESICPAGWRLLMDSEDYNYSDGQTETDFGSEIGSMIYREADLTDNWDIPVIPYASSTLRRGEMSSNSLSGYQNFALNSSSIMHVRCIFGESGIVRTNLTVDFNGATLKVDTWGRSFSMTKMKHYRTWRDDYIYPNTWINRDGYKLLGYSKNKNATEPEYYDNGVYWDEEPDHYIKLDDVLKDNVTVYAVWKKMRSITLDGNGGTNWQGDSWVITFDDDGSILSGGYDEPRWENHRFRGWASSPDATEVEYHGYDEGDGIPTIWEATDVQTFYAVWEDEE